MTRTRTFVARIVPAILMLAATVAPGTADGQAAGVRVSKDRPEPAAARASAALDRRTPPPVGQAPSLRVPTWTTTSLANGARLVVAPKRDLPLVSVNITFVGGSRQFEPAGRNGLSNIAAALLSEGTATRTAEQISETQQLLGTNIVASVGPERGSIGFTALSDRMPAALELLADMVRNATLPADALDRTRARTLVSLAQMRDQPSAIASNAFVRTLYGTDHPYGRYATEASVRAITRDDVVAFHRAYFQPHRAIITVTGDVDPARVRAEVERVLGDWTGDGTPVQFEYPEVTPRADRTIYLVDRPGAAQSSFAIGLPGPPRTTSDYFALVVLNRILGGHIQSRLSHNIREVKGYSYGVGSSFAFGRGPGAFLAGGEIVSAKSDSALIEFMHELRGIGGGRPFAEEELQEAKDALIQGLPRNFATVDALSGAITTLYVDELPQDFWQSYARHVSAITRDDLVRVAREYVNPDRLAIVIVGDRAAIEESLVRTGIAPIVLLEADTVMSPALTP